MNKHFIQAENDWIFREIQNKLTATDCIKEFHPVGFLIDFCFCFCTRRMGWFWFSWLNSRARGLLRHLVNNTARKWRPSVPTAYELFTRAVVCSASFRNGIDRFKWQRPFWEMASTIYEREICCADLVMHVLLSDKLAQAEKQQPQNDTACV